MYFTNKAKKNSFKVFKELYNKLMNVKNFDEFVKYVGIINKEYDYIKRIVVLENNVVKKNFFINKEHYSIENLIIELSNKLMDPNTTHTYTIEALSVNGTIAWSKEITITSLRNLTEEELYQNDMANLAFKIMIENLLEALGN